MTNLFRFLMIFLFFAMLFPLSDPRENPMRERKRKQLVFCLALLGVIMLAIRALKALEKLP